MAGDQRPRLIPDELSASASIPGHLGFELKPGTSYEEAFNERGKPYAAKSVASMLA